MEAGHTNSIQNHSITKYDDFKDACNIRDTYPLYATDSTDNLKPASAFKHKVELDYNSFEAVDTILKKINDCEGSGYCDKGSPQETFAQLKGVPGIYFTSSNAKAEEHFWGDWYPGRGIYMLTKDGQLIELWYYYIEHVECSCI